MLSLLITLLIFLVICLVVFYIVQLILGAMGVGQPIAKIVYLILGAYCALAAPAIAGCATGRAKVLVALPAIVLILALLGIGALLGSAYVAGVLSGR